MSEWWEGPYVLFSKVSGIFFSEGPSPYEAEAKKLVKKLKKENPEAEARLAELGSSAISPLLKALGSGNEKKAEAASRVLAKNWELVGVQRFAREMEAAKFKPVYRERLASLIREIGEPLVDKAIEILPDEEDNWRVRVDAAFVLGISKNEKAIPALIDALKIKRDNYAYIKSNACDALVSIGEPAMPALIAILGDDDRKYYAGRALGEIGLPALLAIDGLLRRKEGLLPKQLAAEKVVEEINDLRAAPRLVGILGSRNSDLREKAYYTLKRMGEKALPEIIEGAKSGNEMREAACIQLLGYAGGRKTRPLLVEALRHKQEYIRIAATEALVKFEIGEGWRHGKTLSLKSRLKLRMLDNESRVRCQIILGSSYRWGILTKLPDIPILIKLLDGREPEETREQAGRLLQGFFFHRRSCMTKMLREHPEKEMRANAAKALGLKRSRKSAGALLEALDSEYPEVRNAALDALGRIEKVPEVAPRLIEILKSRDAGYSQQAVIEALGSVLMQYTYLKLPEEYSGVAKEASQELLGFVLGGQTVEIKKAALASLINIRCRDSVSPLIGMLGAQRGELLERHITAISAIGIETPAELSMLYKAIRDFRKANKEACKKGEYSGSLELAATCYSKTAAKLNRRANAIINDKSFHVPKIEKPGKDKTERVLRVRRSCG